MSSCFTLSVITKEDLITDTTILQIIINSHIQGPTPCFVTTDNRVIAINEEALRVLRQVREDVVGHLASEIVGVPAEASPSSKLMSVPSLVDSAGMPDTDLVVKTAAIERTALKVHWLQNPSSKESSESGELDVSRDSSPTKLHSPSFLSSLRRSPPARSSPLGRLDFVGDHLFGNGVTSRLVEMDPKTQRLAFEVYQSTQQIHQDVRLAKTLEKNRLQKEATGSGFIAANESVDHIKNILSDLFLEGALRSYIEKVNLSRTSIEALDKNFSADWSQVSYVISELLENACIHGGNTAKVILDIEYDATSEKLTIVIQDNGSGMDKDYLQDAVDGKTFTEESTTKTSNPGITLRKCRLLVEDVLGGEFVAWTDFCGTEFKFSFKAMKPSGAAVKTSDVKVEASAVGGAGESTPPPLSDFGNSAFRKIPSLTDEDSITFDEPIVLAKGRHRRLAYSPLTGVESNPTGIVPGLTAIKEHLSLRSVADKGKLSLDAPILYVDDEKNCRTLLGRFMNICQLRSTTEANSGTAAIEKIEEAIRSGKPYQMIFMDQVLGGDDPELTSGNQVAEKIFKIYQEASLPLPIIIPASSNMTPEDVAIYKASGMNCESPLKKPISMEPLKAIVERYFATS